MTIITKFKSYDGSEWSNHDDAVKRENLCDKINAAMFPLGETPQAVKDGDGWLQHDLEVVLCAKDRIIEICREEGLGERFPAFKNPGRKCHPMSIIGRILDDTGGPLSYAWSRFNRIDEKGREHQQPYYAYSRGPLPEHVCVEDRTKKTP